MSWTANDIQSWLGQCADRMVAAAPELNELDGRLGDGDLGATLEKCAKLIQENLVGELKTPGDVFKTCAMACMRASGSSFGTLLSVAFMTLAKETANQTELHPVDVSSLLSKVIEALMSRGKAKLGDKTVIDSLEAIRLATTSLDDVTQLSEIASRAAQNALEEYRNKPNQIGRARMFAERSIGMDDPGMVAALRIIGTKP